MFMTFLLVQERYFKALEGERAWIHGYVVDGNVSDKEL